MRTHKGKAALSLLLALILLLTPTFSASAETIETEPTEPELIEVETAEPETDILPLAEDAGEIVASGTCGENLTWTLSSQRVLTISGTGDMVFDPVVPWYNVYHESIYTVIIEDGVTSIGGGAFSECSNLQSVSIPDSIKKIGDAAFTYTHLTSVTIPASVTEIGLEVFRNCGYLTAITVSDANPQYKSVDGVLLTKDGKRLICCPGAKTGSFAIPDTVTEIGDYAFYYCFTLTGVTIPDSVTSIGISAFEGCLELVSVTIPDSVTSIGERAFLECTRMADLKISNSLTKIEGGTFFACHGLTNVTIPDSVTEISWQAFSECGSLLSITLPDSVTSLGNSVFQDCEKLQSLTIPDSVTDIGDYLCARCRSLERVTIGNGLTDIRYRAFQSCTALKTVTIGSAVNTIGTQAFDCCTALRRIEFLGHAPQYISSDSFASVTANVFYPGDDPSWTDEVKQDYGGKLTWALPDGTLPQTDFLALSGLSGNLVIEIDGVGYDPDENGNVYVPTKDAKIAVIYEYNKLGGDVHEQYPVGMKLALLTYTDKGYQAEYPAVLQNLLHYAGSSIRITGKKGIRMITGIDTKQRDQLIQGSGGYTLLEYGTLVGWDNEIAGLNLTLELPIAKTAFAYKKGEADPVYKVTNGDTQFTNVLVGFSDYQCVPDLSMRPYMKLQDKDGNVLTVYGGVVHRSIGYIALQNRKAFQPGTDSYEYIWSIIHHVYGTKYDADYKK